MVIVIMKRSEEIMKTDVEIFKQVLDEMSIPYTKAKPGVICTINGKDIHTEEEFNKVFEEIFNDEFVRENFNESREFD